MSCFIMSDQAHAATANTLEYILNSGFNRFGFDAPDSLYKALSDCRDRYGFYCSGLIFRRLYDLNSRAYAGRYKTVTDTTPPEMPGKIAPAPMMIPCTMRMIPFLMREFFILLPFYVLRPPEKRRNATRFNSPFCGRRGDASGGPRRNFPDFRRRAARCARRCSRASCYPRRAA